MNALTHALRQGLVLALSLVACNVWACSTKGLQRQLAVMAEFGVETPQLPQEISLRAGDLVSVLAPLSSAIQVMDAQHHATHALTALEPARYQVLRRYQGGKTPVEIQAGVYPTHLGWLHFGANQPGVVYLQLTTNAEHALLRMDIAEPLIAQPGHDWVWSAGRQNDLITLTPFDTLTLRLPGKPGDGWQAETDVGPVAVTSIIQETPTTGNASHQVLLRLATAPLLTGGSKRRLRIRHADDTYHFTIQPSPQAAC